MYFEMELKIKKKIESQFQKHYAQSKNSNYISECLKNTILCSEEYRYFNKHFQKFNNVSRVWEIKYSIKTLTNISLLFVKVNQFSNTLFIYVIRSDEC